MVGAMRNPSPRNLAKDGHLLCESVEPAAMPLSYQRASWRSYLQGGLDKLGGPGKPFIETNAYKRRKLNSTREELKDEIRTLADRVMALRKDVKPVRLALNNIEDFPNGDWMDGCREGAKQVTAVMLRIIEKDIAKLRHSLDYDTDSD